MNKTKNFQTKLKSYSAIAGTLVAAANTAGAQIIYTDVSPDEVVNTGGAYNLDLNNDGTVDYQFQVTHGTNSAYGFPIQYDLAAIVPVPGSGNAIDTLNGPIAHNLNDPLNSTNAWVDDAGASYQLLGLNLPSLAYQTGNFIGTTDKYIGFKFKISGADHYGWVRIDLNSTATSLTIKDYAYDATANTQILAGAMPLGINEAASALAENVTIFSSDRSVRVNMNNASATGFITVTNALGQEIAKKEISDALMSISMETASKGIYYVTVQQESATITKKVVIN
jgi:hypothetical protein